MNLRIATLALTLPALAHADGVDPSAPPPPPGVEQPAAGDVDARRGLHVGFSVGGAYLPAGGGVSAGVARIDVNFGHGWIEHRISPITYAADSPDQSTYGLGVVYEERISIGRTYSFGLGVLLAYESTSNGSSSATGALFTPIALRLGARKAFELGVTALVIHEPDLGNQNYGGYLSFGWLNL
ncbi:MAG: hypothetical protein ABI867_23825 [Kofleriaceae bacterium]